MSILNENDLEALIAMMQLALKRAQREDLNSRVLKDLVIAQDCLRWIAGDCDRFGEFLQNVGRYAARELSDGEDGGECSIDATEAYRLGRPDSDVPYVVHDKYGPGVISRKDETYVTIAFADGRRKKFKRPAVDRHLVFPNSRESVAVNLGTAERPRWGLMPEEFGVVVERPNGDDAFLRACGIQDAG